MAASSRHPTLVLPQHPSSRIDAYVQTAQDGLKRPAWGDGLPADHFADGDWRTHLCPEGATPEQALALIHSTLLRADVQPTDIGYEEALEGVRRIVWDHSWPQPWWSSAPRAYLSREQAEIIAASLLAELPTATADAVRSRRGPVRASALPMYPLLPHLPVQRGPVQDAAMVGLHSAAPLAFRLLINGLGARWLATSEGGLHYLDTGPPRFPAEVGAPPLLLVHQHGQVAVLGGHCWPASAHQAASDAVVCPPKTPSSLRLAIQVHGLHTTSVCWALQDGQSGRLGCAIAGHDGLVRLGAGL